ncbi:MAG TPA: MFS transporter [Candidatus Binatia bacterium]|jgi:MFS family permease|nr:MFS transporter [Candidatus Binatia bacterium]
MPSRYRWVVLAVSVVAFLQTHLHRLGFAPLIPTFVADLGLGYAAAGTIQTAYFWTYTVVQVPVGVVADRWGARRVMAACMGVLALGAVAFALSGSFAAAVGARMLVGLGAAAVWVPAMRLVSEWFPAGERARATGLVSAGGAVGGTLGLLVVPWVAAVVGWRWAYGLTALPALLTLVLVAALVRPGPAAAVTPSMGASLGRVLRTGRLWPFNLMVFFSYGAYFSFLTFLPAFLVAGLGASGPQAGLITGLITAGTIVSWPLAGWVSDRRGRRKPLTLASQAAGALASVAFALLVPRLDLLGAGLTALAAGLLVGGMILPFVMVVELFPPHLAATAAGVANTACFVGGMILPIVLGWIADVTGGFTASFLLAAALQAVAFICGLLLTETGRPGAGGSRVDSRTAAS